MSKSFLCFEFLWGFEGLANNPDAYTRHYGLGIGYWFFGIVIASLRKESHGNQG